MVNILCGLGNPGLRYQNTRHNIGFEAIERLTERYPVIESGRANGFAFQKIATTVDDWFLVKPETFMNRSGWAAVEALTMFNAEPAQLFVIVDDFNIPLGRIRLRRSGSDGGHKGLISIIESLETDCFPRLRLGIGPLPEYCRENTDLIPEFVLGTFSQSEREIVDKMITLGIEALVELIDHGLEPAIRQFNNRNVFPTPDQ
ncbi:MAG: aminoacyl-tRNA hydrolase [Candidatus Zixiibacteriota bacterium]